MPAFNAARGTTRRPRRRYVRRGLSKAKVRYQPPTARNQRRQIMSNRRQIASNTRFINRHKLYTDYQLDTYIAPQNFTWSSLHLCEFRDWNPVLRKDITVENMTHTFVKRMQMNLRFVLNDMDYCYFSFFIVTPRRDSADRDFFALAPVLNQDWIEAPQSQGSLIRLNPAVVKVHYAKYVTLTANSLNSAIIPGATAGDPRTTYRKFQVNMNLNMKVSLPTYSVMIPNWKEKPFTQLPYYHKYQILCYTAWAGAVTGLTPSVVTDVLFTNVNTD